MAGSLHLEVPTALEYFASLVADDASLPVVEAAAALAQDDDPGLDVQGLLAQIDALADRLTRRIAPDAPALLRLRLLNRYFFHELGFGGNVNDYDDRRNSLLPCAVSYTHLDVYKRQLHERVAWFHARFHCGWVASARKALISGHRMATIWAASSWLRIKMCIRDRR